MPVQGFRPALGFRPGPSSTGKAQHSPLPSQMPTRSAAAAPLTSCGLACSMLSAWGVVWSSDVRPSGATCSTWRSSRACITRWPTCWLLLRSPSRVFWRLGSTRCARLGTAGAAGAVTAGPAAKQAASQQRAGKEQKGGGRGRRVRASARLLMAALPSQSLPSASRAQACVAETRCRSGGSALRYVGMAHCVTKTPVSCAL